MLAGVELVSDRESKTPFDPKLGIAGKIAAYCLDKGLMVLSGVTGTSDGIVGDALQISPALTMTPEEMDVAIAILREAIISVTAI